MRYFVAVFGFFRPQLLSYDSMTMITMTKLRKRMMNDAPYIVINSQSRVHFALEKYSLEEYSLVCVGHVEIVASSLRSNV